MLCYRRLAHLLLLVLIGAGLLVPAAESYGWCSEYWNWDGRRNLRDGKRWPAGDGVVITYVNGIYHTKSEMENITQQLQKLFGHEVRSFYNPSSGWWFQDASRAGYNLIRKPSNDTISKGLGDHLAQAVNDAGRGRVLHIAHSGGALLTYLAAQFHLSQAQRDKIDVLTFGGAYSITRKYFSGRVVNYYARNDPIVLVDRRASDLMKTTNNTKFQEVFEKHDTKFVFLEGQARKFIQDHSLEGPTYQHALRQEAKAFRRSHFGPLSPLAWDYEDSALRMARKQVAQLSGIHNFFDSDFLGLRTLRKNLARLTGFHGFFSGKVGGTSTRQEHAEDTALVPASNPSRERGLVSSLVGRIWRSGTGDEEDVMATVETTTDSAEEQGSRQRFWLGWRWKRKDEGVEGTLDGAASTVTTVAEVGTASEDGSKRRWTWFRNVFGYRKGDSSSEVADHDEGVRAMDSADAGGSQEPPGVEEVQEGRLAEMNRPWLSFGWTRWGPTRTSDEGDPERDVHESVNATGEEAAPLRGHEESSALLPTGKNESMSQNQTGSGGLLDLKRWWPRGSTTDQVVTDEPGVDEEQVLTDEDRRKEMAHERNSATDPASSEGEEIGESNHLFQTQSKSERSMLRPWEWMLKEARNSGPGSGADAEDVNTSEVNEAEDAPRGQEQKTPIERQTSDRNPLANVDEVEVINEVNANHTRDMTEEVDEGLSVWTTPWDPQWWRFWPWSGTRDTALDEATSDGLAASPAPAGEGEDIGDTEVVPKAGMPTDRDESNTRSHRAQARLGVGGDCTPEEQQEESFAAHQREDTNTSEESSTCLMSDAESESPGAPLVERVSESNIIVEAFPDKGMRVVEGAGVDGTEEVVSSGIIVLDPSSSDEAPQVRSEDGVDDGRHVRQEDLGNSSADHLVSSGEGRGSSARKNDLAFTFSSTKRTRTGRTWGWRR